MYRVFLSHTVVVCPGDLREPDNGAIEYSQDPPIYQSLARYLCASGYMLDGTENRMCQADGTWNGNSPICRRKQLQYKWQ